MPKLLAKDGNITMSQKSAFFKALNMLAAKMEVIDENGNLVNDRAGRMKTAYAVLVELKDAKSIIDNVGQLFSREQLTQLVKLLVKAEVAKVEEQGENVPRETDAKKRSGNNTRKQAERKPKAPKVQTYDFAAIPDEHMHIDILNNLFSKDVIEGVNFLIRKTALDINAHKGLNLVERYQNFYRGIYELKQLATYTTKTVTINNREYEVTPYKKLTSIMLTYFLGGIAKYLINQRLTMGLNYDKLETRDIEQLESDYSYQNAPSSYGNITEYEIDDLFHTLISDSLRLTFSEKMFHIITNSKGEQTTNVWVTLYYRVSNLMQVEMRKLRKQTKVYQTLTIEGEPVENRSIEEMRLNPLKFAEESGMFSDIELTVLKMTLEGYNKREIDKALGKRTDRDFQRIQKKLSLLA